MRTTLEPRQGGSARLVFSVRLVENSLVNSLSMGRYGVGMEGVMEG